MKISYIIKEESERSRKFREASERHGIEFEQVRLEPSNFEETIGNLGDVVIWHSSLLDVPQGMNSFLRSIGGKLLINEGFREFPFIFHKFFQQKLILHSSDIPCIDTYIFKNKDELVSSIKKGELSFPIIKKPNLGARGEGIELIKSESELESVADLEKSVFQNFIPNDGDFRVLVVNGKILGVIKRTAGNGNFLNNFSQGGSVCMVSDPDQLKELEKIALEVARRFKLFICGVDIIYDKSKNKYFFMEVNSIPQWNGFEAAVGVDVIEKILVELESSFQPKA